MSTVKKYISYFNERFPIPGVLLYSGSLFWLSYSFANIYAQRSSWNSLDFILGLILFFLIFLHLRIFDEHKDYARDIIAYPERLLSRGVISLRDLRILLYPVLIIEAAIALFLGIAVGIAWLGALLWTLLMLKEFFIPEYLNKRIGMYLISHQLLVPLMIAIPLSMRIQSVTFQAHEISSLIFLCTGAMCFTVTYELGRKTWSPDREDINADSYTREWGIEKTLLITLLISFLGTSIFSWFMLECDISGVYIIINFLLLLILAICELFFYKKQTKKLSKTVELAGAVYMLGTFINSSIAFTMYLI